MAVLDPNDVKSGRVLPHPGDFVSGYAYVSGDPKSNKSYRPLEGEEYLSSIPPQRANIARAVLAGKQPLPPLSRLNPFNQQLLLDVRNTEPGFDATTWKRRVDMIHEFTVGKTAQLIRALNQAPLHALTLAQAYDQLHNLSVGGETVNNLLTYGEAAIGNRRQQAGMGAFNESQPAVASELGTIYKGGPATIPDIEEQRRAFPMGAAPTTANSAMSAASELMVDRLNTIDQQWQNGMGVGASMFPGLGSSAISPHSRAALKTLYARYHPENTDSPTPKRIKFGELPP